jgi:hypothetical protein
MPAPSPVKKKLSLSDYAKRRAALPSGATGTVLNRAATTESTESPDVVMKDAPESGIQRVPDSLPPPPLPPSASASAAAPADAIITSVPSTAI